MNEVALSDRRWLHEAAQGAAGGLTLPHEREAVETLSNLDLAGAWRKAAQMAGASLWELATAVSARMGLPLATPEMLAMASSGITRRIPARLVEERGLRVVEGRDGILTIITSDPADQELLQLVQFAADGPVRFCVAPPLEVDAPASVLRAPPPAAAERSGSTGVLAPADVVLDLDRADDEEVEAVRMGNQMLREALQRQASDVHVQPLAEEGVIRIRIDGSLQSLATVSPAVLQALVARLKVLAGMDPTDQVRPQDGGMRIHFHHRLADLRLASVPCEGGEKLVIRMLNGSRVASLRDVGLGQPERDHLAVLLQRRQGLVLMTGPTGSGKSTTIYGALAELNDPGVNISTVEDPVEMRIAGLTQIAVNPKAGMTFAAALRAVLRQDPDILLVGEIRDSETAQIAVQAAMTGHLVLASLHANDAVAALPRMRDLGVSPQLLADALAGTTAQRLLRRVCPSCTRQAPIDANDPAASWLKQHAGLQALSRAEGCAHCEFRGYRGRLPVCQVMEVTPELAVGLVAEESTSRLRAIARAAGMRLLSESALDLLRDGSTTLDEVQRALGSSFWLDLGIRYGAPAFRPSPRDAQQVAAQGDPPPAAPLPARTAIRQSTPAPGKRLRTRLALHPAQESGVAGVGALPASNAEGLA